MGTQVLIAKGLTSQQADDLIAATNAPPTTATDVKKVPVEGTQPQLFNVQATFPSVEEDDGEENTG
jgi:hypothetical protein